MLGDEVWLTVSVPVYPEGVGRCGGQGSVQSCQIPPLKDKFLE